ncbi:pyridoxamine 5'-phosphate oxidase family protein [Sphingorhabdus sp. IMCC26285]|uniref:Pyridoxamine 5'-phosphate oxidase family protein n=1 Tax=Sphingorhabdus profundilacus TaxID=2509718 RepID=A0A6I4LU47_9SPHN|nr:pyridoxamine 5'-phosphate oxidase family protein [Sphingorhabdus profundilacus]MVZ96319.1 pyridoxamine 5'-phosphate oxidase family protein [Sphingorhabdus profundilacus]
MARNYVHTLFTDVARAMQEVDGSRSTYARMEEGADGTPDLMTDKEAGFIAARDSFYIASVTPEGWPYVQHRGGAAGFLRALSGNRLGFADYQGNRQHVSNSNLVTEPRVSLFLMDYPNRRRLKILGQAQVVSAAQDAALITSLMPDGYKAMPERAYIIDVVGFDWNCPQHITPRFTESEISAVIQPLNTELNHLRAEVEALRAISKGE